VENLILGLDLATTSSGAVVLDGEKLIFEELIQPPSCVINPLERIEFIHKKINNIFENYHIKYVAIEDIGLSYSINLKVAKNNLLLIGSILCLSNLNGSSLVLLQSSEWRKLVGVYADKVAQAQMKREFQKQKGIEIANEIFGFNFSWISDYQDKKDHQSDIAEASLIALACYKIFKKGGNFCAKEDGL
jgi:hypothetical protein